MTLRLCRPMGTQRSCRPHGQRARLLQRSVPRSDPSSHHLLQTSGLIYRCGLAGIPPMAVPNVAYNRDRQAVIAEWDGWLHQAGNSGLGSADSATAVPRLSAWGTCRHRRRRVRAVVVPRLSSLSRWTSERSVPLATRSMPGRPPVATLRSNVIVTWTAWQTSRRVRSGGQLLTHRRGWTTRLAVHAGSYARSLWLQGFGQGRTRSRRGHPWLVDGVTASLATELHPDGNLCGARSEVRSGNHPAAVRDHDRPFINAVVLDDGLVPLPIGTRTATRTVRSSAPSRARHPSDPPEPAPRGPHHPRPSVPR